MLETSSPKAILQHQNQKRWQCLSVQSQNTTWKKRRRPVVEIQSFRRWHCWLGWLGSQRVTVLTASIWIPRPHRCFGIGWQVRCQNHCYVIKLELIILFLPLPIPLAPGGRRPAKAGPPINRHPLALSWTVSHDHRTKCDLLFCKEALAYFIYSPHSVPPDKPCLLCGNHSIFFSLRWVLRSVQLRADIYLLLGKQLSSLFVFQICRRFVHVFKFGS